MSESGVPWDEERLSAVDGSASWCPDACAADVRSLVGEVRRLREALAFYADSRNFAHGHGDVEEMMRLRLDRPDPPVISDRGKRARQALGLTGA